MSWTEIWQVIYKTIFCFFFLIVILKIMGKREIGKISTFDIVVFFIISELFSLSLNDPSGPILHSIIPITVIVVLQMSVAFLSLKSQKIRGLVEGKVTYIIYKGELMQDEMKRQRYNIDDLLAQLRSKDIQLPSEVEFALLEDSGSLSIVKKSESILQDPEPLISDGKFMDQTLKRLHLDRASILIKLTNEGYTSEKEVFLAMATTTGLYVLPRKLSSHKKDANKYRN